MIESPKLILVPIDNRPVTCDFPALVASIAGVDTLLPPRPLIGSNRQPANLEELSQWLSSSLAKVKADGLVVCLDAVLYGGLVASRCSQDSLAEITKRSEKIATWKTAGGDKQVLAQSSIMRIPHYNGATGEPEYWQHYGEKIFAWSVLLHQEKLGVLKADSELKEKKRAIPQAVREDFLKRRERNFRVNQNLVTAVKSGQIDFLVFSQDDTGEFGLNVWEKSQLLAQVKAMALTNIDAYPGTDEVILTLMSRWLISRVGRKPHVVVHFSPEDGRHTISRFEGQTIAASLSVQADAVGLDVALDDASRENDFAVIVHTGGDAQGDHIATSGSSAGQSRDTAISVESTLRLLQAARFPVVLCDVAYANGADPMLVEKLLSRKDLLDKLWAYAGWNTTGNTIGSAIALGVANWYAGLHDFPARAACKRALFVRFADDWAYQAVVRCQLAGQPSEERLDLLMAPLLERLENALEFDAGKVAVRLPWNRTFEVEIALPNPENVPMPAK